MTRRLADGWALLLPGRGQPPGGLLTGRGWLRWAQYIVDAPHPVTTILTGDPRPAVELVGAGALAGLMVSWRQLAGAVERGHRPAAPGRPARLYPPGEEEPPGQDDGERPQRLSRPAPVDDGDHAPGGRERPTWRPVLNH